MGLNRELRQSKYMYIVIATVITVVLLYFIDQVLLVSYNMKIIAKLILFMIFPVIYIVKGDYNFIKKPFENNHKKVHIHSIVLGIITFAIIFLFYNVFKETINVENLINEFQNKYLIENNQIIYYGLYITIINSFLEEFFFRGFVFLNLLNLGFKKTAYIFSSLMFALYHIANIENWFSIATFFIAVTGLFVAGMIFNKLDQKEENFKNSWFVHICADAAIVIIGYNIMVN